MSSLWRAARRPSQLGPAWYLGGFAAGVAVQLQQATLWPTWAHAVVLGGAALALLLIGVRRRPGSGWLAVLLAAALGFGLTQWRAHEFVKTSLNPALDAHRTKSLCANPTPPRRLVPCSNAE